ncbi:hypothetical protein [Vibrio parahaemolyticus]|uniref:hypothetical protein n=1 Tax=Vibrio parahaemolyticus TaxID=670 RepID=UPI001124331B|nr:hypothetical protein [Vibrio parahaemolyticus]EGR0905729.1 hypothetical protein [Vibrio parahaemolyticus]MBE4422401.1 hypothetical protein [Vibrio parahaemolyticus]TOH24816.1 hypothetical protein CGI83_23815 [Vibrio parahaemolyticus]HCG9147187.1 hypothetical protein [Vibrio parahaemolyticus]
MTKILLLMLVFIPLFSPAEEFDPFAEQSRLEALSKEQMNKGLYDQAIETLSELDGMFPYETDVLLQLVTAYVKAGKQVPDWVMETPWPTATDDDLLNREKAEKLLGQ